MDGATGAGTPELEVRLLGPIEAERAGARVPLGGLKPRSLLAVLALEPGHVVSVDRLVDALWPGDPPETAPHAVQVYVSQLRKALGPVIVTRPPGYELEIAAECVDLHRFTRLAQEGRDALAGGDPVAAERTMRDALALWRGPALSDFVYEPFAQTEIARLEELRTVVLEERIEADLALGRHAELVAELEALVQAQPLRERPRAQLMLALYRTGRQADALAAYRAARETLVEELGIDPGPELRELEAAILRQDDSLLLDDAALATPAMQFRRLATILFVDVVDSMALTELLDAEAVGDVQRRYFEAVAGALRRHGGTVEKFAGDAVMAAFGIPVSHEDDALRAARAAFDIQVAVQALSEGLQREHGLGLEVRIGLAAGEVVASTTEAHQRFVAGDAVGVAARLQHSAQPGEIVVGEIVARLIDHAARLEPLGTLDVKSRKTPIAMYRLVELEPVAPAFERRLDARFVGRKRELAALRRSLKRTVDSKTARVALVTAPPGVGKSRLVAEFTRRAKGVTTLRGRCLSYGDGITYWPLREILAEAAESEERAAVLGALESETSLPAPEIALLFRRFCEAHARRQPLVVVVDDVHWAEPTLLELVEHVADKGEGSILVVCLAREELAESPSTFLEGRPNADRIELDGLSADETEALLDGLGGEILESDQRARVIEAAEGNPLFLEQLVALALEGGLTEQRVPETLQALLAARLDRLGPGERAVLERGAVIGKEFRLDDVAALLDPEAAPTAEVHMSSLVARGFVRPGTAGEFRFRHVLVRDAVYRAAPKRLRAELHERFIDRFEARHEAVADVDEFAGYHFEQAYRLRTELGESDRRAQSLGEAAGRRLGEAGIRASKRDDARAAVNLLGRATSIPSVPDALASELLSELGIVLRASGALADAVEVLEQAIVRAQIAEDRLAEARARMEHAYVVITFEARTSDDLLEIATNALPLFEAAGAERLVGRAWLLIGWVHGGHRGQYLIRLEAAERALLHYRRSTWPVSTAVGEIANALYFGPVAVPDAIDRCAALMEITGLDGAGRANVQAYLGGIVAQTGDFERAHATLTAATAAFEELGQRTSAATFSSAVQGEVHLLAGETAVAAEHLRWLCAELESTHAYSHLASAAGVLADALYRLGDFDGALESTATAEHHAAADDFDAHMLWMPVRAKLLARDGAVDEATTLGSAAVDLAATTDSLNRRARAVHDLGEVQTMAGRVGDARACYEAARGLYELKGNVVGARQMRALLDDPALV